MEILTGKRIRFVGLCLSTFLILTVGTVFSQSVGGNRVPPRSPVPTPAQPTPHKPPPTTQRPTPPPGKVKPATEELDKARDRIRDKREAAEKAEEESAATNQPAPSIPSPWDLQFEDVDDKDLRVLSSRWKTVALKGKNPFTVLTVRVANLSDRYLSVLNLVMKGQRLAAHNALDLRPIPKGPVKLERFKGARRLPTPIHPRSEQDLTFTFPFALKSTAKLEALVERYVKFKPKAAAQWNPVEVVGWELAHTASQGKNHTGLLVTVRNKASYPVKAKLKVELDKLASAGGNTFFTHTLALKKEEEKTVAIRTIPDEGCLPDDPEKETRPPSFEVKSVEVLDLQY